MLLPLIIYYSQCMYIDCYYPLFSANSFSSSSNRIIIPILMRYRLLFRSLLSLNNNNNNNNNFMNDKQ